MTSPTLSDFRLPQPRIPLVLGAIALFIGALPVGLTFNGDSVLAGTPTAAGNFPVTITATTGVGNPATLDATVTGTPVADLLETGALGQWISSVTRPGVGRRRVVARPADQLR